MAHPRPLPARQPTKPSTTDPLPTPVSPTRSPTVDAASARRPAVDRRSPPQACASRLPPSVELPTPPWERSSGPAAPPLLLLPALPSSPTRSRFDPPILTRRNCYAAAWPARSPAKRRILLVGDRQYGTLLSVSPYHGKMHETTLEFLLDPIPRDDARFRSPCLRRGHDQSDPPLWGILISCLLFPKVK